MKDITREQLVELYEKHKTYESVGKELGIGISGVYHQMKKHDIKPLYHRKYDVDDDFFSRDNEKSFYWAGFLAADGNISYNNKCVIPTLVKLKISTVDLEHLELFKSQLKSESPIKIVSAKAQDGRDLTYGSITISSEKLVKDLGNRFNIVPNKTLKYKFPKWLIDHPLVHHFMRGYVDGDGCFCFGKTKKSTSIGFYVLGTKSFLLDFQKTLMKKTNIEYKNKLDHPSKIYRLGIKGNKVMKKISGFLYQDATIFLKRKKDIACAEIPNLRTDLIRNRISKEDIRFISKSKLSARKLAKQFGINKSAVFNIRHNKYDYGI